MLARFVLWLIRLFPILSADYRAAAGSAPADLSRVRQFRESLNSVRLFHRPGGLPMPHVPCNVGL